MMKKIVIASHNPVKIEAVQAGFSRMFPGEDYGVESISVDSGVGHQPLSEQLAREGAENRARQARLAIPEGDFWVGVEGDANYKEMK